MLEIAIKTLLLRFKKVQSNHNHEEITKWKLAVVKYSSRQLPHNRLIAISKLHHVISALVLTFQIAQRNITSLFQLLELTTNKKKQTKFLKKWTVKPDLLSVTVKLSEHEYWLLIVQAEGSRKVRRYRCLKPSTMPHRISTSSFSAGFFRLFFFQFNMSANDKRNSKLSTNSFNFHLHSLFLSHLSRLGCVNRGDRELKKQSCPNDGFSRN